MAGTIAPVVTGLVCAGCGTEVPIASGALVCPRSSAEDRNHVLHFVSSTVPFRPADSANPFVAYRKWLAVDAYGASLGIDDAERERVIVELDAQVATVAGTGFLRTPLSRAEDLSSALGFSATGGVWIKDETGSVGGSHKARHLFTEMLRFLFAERAGISSVRPRLAISSCGNAAIAASTIARAVDWPIDVFVPPSASQNVLDTLASLGATVNVCPRRESDPAGDPCVLRFREAVASGSLPFGVQGTENAWCRDGGRTIGWEITDDLAHKADRIFVQVGGGAFAACVGEALRTAGVHPMLHAVQTAGCAPLERAWRRAAATGGVHNVGERWSECMWPWEEEPHSLADGILDDETYDWIGVLEGMASTGGSPVVASEDLVVRAHELAREHTDINVSPTGSAGLAGLLAVRNHVSDDERVVVIFSGVAR